MGNKPINIELTESLFKYGELREIVKKNFSSKSELKKAISEYKEQGRRDKRACDKWLLNIQTNTGINFTIKIDL